MALKAGYKGIKDNLLQKIMDEFSKIGAIIPSSASADNKLVTEDDLETSIPTKTSDLENDSHFISELPIASSSTLGGVKVGQNLTITSDGTLNAIGGGGNNYSTEESVIGYWIDDKPLYRKVYTENVNPISCQGSGFTIVGTLISKDELDSLDISEMVNKRVYYYGFSSVGNNIPYSINDLSQLKEVYDDINGIHLSFVNNTGAAYALTGGKAYIIIEYTKTTD